MEEKAALCRFFFLCGRDESTGQDYEHRRAWIEEEILRLAEVFALDVSAYGVMSNQFSIQMSGIYR